MSGTCRRLRHRGDIDQGNAQKPQRRRLAPSALEGETVTSMKNTIGSIAGPQAPSRLAAALIYAGYGWQVFPVHTMQDGRCSCREGATCKQSAKHPWTRNGFKDGTTDQAKIKRWWQEHPDANIGIVTGETSGIVVIDVDPRNGGDKSIKELIERLGKIPPGPVVKTGGGGWHIFALYPGHPVKKPSHNAPGIDIKSDGGYVVAAGSIHASGSSYTWHVPPDRAVLPALPEAWLSWLNPHPPDSLPYATERTECTESTESTERTECTEDDRGLQRNTEAITSGSVASHTDQLIDRLVEKVIVESLPGAMGQRNRQVFELARARRRSPHWPTPPRIAYNPTSGAGILWAWRAGLSGPNHSRRRGSTFSRVGRRSDSRKEPNRW